MSPGGACAHPAMCNVMCCSGCITINQACCERRKHMTPHRLAFVTFLRRMIPIALAGRRISEDSTNVTQKLMLTFFPIGLAPH